MLGRLDLSIRERLLGLELRLDREMELPLERVLDFELILRLGLELPDDTERESVLRADFD